MCFKPPFLTIYCKLSYINEADHVFKPDLVVAIVVVVVVVAAVVVVVVVVVLVVVVVATVVVVILVVVVVVLVLGVVAIVVAAAAAVVVALLLLSCWRFSVVTILLFLFGVCWYVISSWYCHDLCVFVRLTMFICKLIFECFCCRSCHYCNCCCSCCYSCVLLFHVVLDYAGCCCSCRSRCRRCCCYAAATSLDHNLEGMS